MKVLIIGGAGMLGHKLVQTARKRFDTSVTLRGSFDDYAIYEGLFERERTFDRVDVQNLDALRRIFERAKPDAVVNCVGIIKQLKEAYDPIVSIRTNSLFPHELASVATESGARMLHISTDCVFSGSRGMYREEEIPDPPDLYGRSKLLGEVGAPHLTLRTSIIGRELGTSTSGLVEWFLAQEGPVRGYRRAVFSGFPTLVLAELICDVIERHPELAGLYHASAEPINKYDILRLVRDSYRKQIDIDPFDDFVIDRSLDSTRFRSATGFQPPSWEELIRRMADDPTPYSEWRAR